MKRHDTIDAGLGIEIPCDPHVVFSAREKRALNAAFRILDQAADLMRTPEGDHWDDDSAIVRAYAALSEIADA